MNNKDEYKIKLGINNISQENKKYINYVENVIKIITLITLIFGAIVFIVSRTYAKNCCELYGIDKRYFYSAELFYNKMIFLIGIVLIVIMLYFLEKVLNDIGMYIITYSSMVILNILSLSIIYNYISIDFIRNVLNNSVYFCCINIILIILCGASAVLFILIKNLEIESKEWQIKVFITFIIIQSIIILFGISTYLETSINDKKTYEVINKDKVIITEYEGKFLVLNCDIDTSNEKLTIYKGEYEFIEMMGNKITTKEYKEVLVKNKEQKIVKIK